MWWCVANYAAVWVIITAVVQKVQRHPQGPSWALLLALLAHPVWLLTVVTKNLSAYSGMIQYVGMQQ
jgi:hypothetical protein